MELQQGDVILTLIDEDIKEGIKEKNLVLAEGEATGHHHSIVSGVAQIIALQGTEKGRRILEVLSEEALLKHQEHNEIRVPKGKWEIKIVREYDHFEEEVRRVMD